MKAIERLIALAEEQIGIKEDMAGHVKYSDEYGLPCQPWCMMFLWWLYKHSDLKDIFYDGKKCAGCGTFLRWAQATVQKGDSLWKLAKQFYGSGSKYPIIKEANNITKDTIYVGQQLKIPAPIIRR